MTVHKGTTPPYTITPAILNLVARIDETIGGMDEAAVQADIRLRRINRIRSIHGSLAIEGNTLSEDEITTIVEGQRVIAPAREIREARNAIDVYDQYQLWNPESQDDLLKAHELLMVHLIETAGRYRNRGVGVIGGGEVHHVAPHANRVPMLMSNLLSWLKDSEGHPLITSSVFHYEFEFIHPFEDGNGRMGRLWQTLILTRWKSIFSLAPVESLVYARQRAYYEAIRASTARVDSAPFIEFMLQAILEAVLEIASTDQESDHLTDQVIRLLGELRNGPSGASKLMAALGLSHRPTFRKNYIRPALDAGLIEMTNPQVPTARNQKYRLTARGRSQAAVL